MTTFAIAGSAEPSGELETIAETNPGIYWGDLAREAVTGSDRGLVITASAIIESQLRDLLVSDPGTLQPEMVALIAPGGSLCHRNGLVNYLDQNGFMTDREAAAIRSLFECADRYFDWSGKGSLESTQWTLLEPFLAFTQDPEMPSHVDKDRTGFFWASWEITNSLLTHISNREAGLA